MLQRRVVITGIGLVSPLGCGEGSKIFTNILKGKSGIKSIDEYNKLGYPNIDIPAQCDISAIARVPIKLNKEEDVISDGIFNYDDSKYKTIERETSKFIRFALDAASYAVKNAGFENTEDIFKHYSPLKCGAAIGNGGIGSLPEINSTYKNLESNSYRKISPYFVPKILVNMAAGHVSMNYNLQGPVHCVTTACAAGSHSIGDAYNFIRLGYADLMFSGGSDCSIDPVSLSGFSRMKALVTGSNMYNCGKNIEASSRPFDKNRNGFVMGEGAGVLILEELSSALKRNAPIIAEVCGYGMSGDAYHLTSPSPDGSGALNSMKMAISDAKISSKDLGYINAHATSTPLGDTIEINAVKRLIKENENSTQLNPLYISSTKGATGHLLGAAGAVETAFTALALQTQMIPPTLNLDEIDSSIVEAGEGVVKHVPNKGIHYSTGSDFETTTADSKITLNYALNNSFGFGGMNASLVLKKFN